MKKVLLIIAVAVLAMTLVPFALAGGQSKAKKHGHYKFNLVGVVRAPDEQTPAVDAGTISIKVQGGSHIKGLKRTLTTFDVASDAKVRQLRKHNRTVVRTLADISAGDKVKVRGIVTKYADGSKTYTITAIKYLDRTPDVEPTTPPATE